MQPYKDHPSPSQQQFINNSDDENNNISLLPPRYVHHDATMFKPIDQQEQDPTSSSNASASNTNNMPTKKFITDTSKRRKVEELQRTIEITDRLQQSAENTVLASKLAVGMECISFSLCAFLANFGLRHSNPQQSFLRRFADTNLRLARFGSFYSLVGLGGMAMSATYIPMEWQAIDNANMTVAKLQETQGRAVQERNDLLDEMARAVGLDPETAQPIPDDD